MYTIQELEDIKKKFESPAQQPQGPNKRRLADVINVEEQPAPVAKADPVAVPEKKIGTMIITRVKKEKR